MLGDLTLSPACRFLRTFIPEKLDVADIPQTKPNQTKCFPLKKKKKNQTKC